MKAFRQLVTVKRMREDKAERAVHAQRRVLVQAQCERDDAQKRLDDYCEYAVEQERRVYRELCERVVKLRDIEDVQGQVRVLRAQEADHRESRDNAEARREQARVQLDEDRAAHRFAMRAHDKFVQLQDEFTRQAQAQAERAEDAEIEEVAGNRRPESAHQEPA